MKLFSLLFSVACLAVFCTAEKGQHENEQTLDINSLAAMLGAKPTIATPTKVPTAQVSPNEKFATTENELKAEALIIKLPAFVNDSLQATVSKPLDVAGFIDKNGDIYKIANKSVVGIIRSRQAKDDGQHICNYGSVLIYSDVPCNQVTNVRVAEVEETAALDETSAPVMQQQNKQTEENIEKPNENVLVRPNKNGQNRPNKTRPGKNGQNRPNQTAQNRPSQNAGKRPNQNSQKRPNKNSQKRPNKNPQKRPNKNPQKRPNKNSQKRPNKNGQKRPNKQGQKSPNQNTQKHPNQNGHKRPVKHVQKLPINANNKSQSLRSQQDNERRWQDEEDEDDVYDDELYFQNQHKRIQAQRYISDYNDFQ